MLSKKQFGDWGENLAIKYLEKKNFLIIDRNIHNRFGEIDILAKKNDILHCVEVRTKSIEYLNRIENPLTVYKQYRIVAAISEYMGKNNIMNDYQFDFMLIFVDKSRKIAKVIFVQNYDFDEQLIDSF